MTWNCNCFKKYNLSFHNKESLYTVRRTPFIMKRILPKEKQSRGDPCSRPYSLFFKDFLSQSLAIDFDLNHVHTRTKC